MEDLRSVRSTISWNLKPCILRLFSWTPYFNPNIQRQTGAQCWLRILGLPQEYWRLRILFAIAGSIGTPICLDEATNKKAFERSYGHFARVLIDVDLTSNFRDKFLVEREDFAFFMGIQYEKLPDFCTSCQNIGHTLANCRRQKDVSKGE